MHLKNMKEHYDLQKGVSLIEVLVAILLLSFGMLALGAMLSFAVQAPKLSAYRATASNLAASHVERLRANPEGFANNRYTSTLHGSSWTTDVISPTSADCAYPDCTETTLAAMDIQATRGAVRRELPAGDIEMWCSAASAPTTATACTQTSQGNLWVIWQEPSTNSLLGASSDQCPPDVTSTYTGYPTTPTPARCLYLRFKIE
ncbi:MAG: type IV pilus modification protein PilV [Rhodoferax sp.]|uniref:type IV pilus modification protein PilV n=1 Tax=Rhodoferax sp. TaxID=50421 RepID=UPI003018B2AD